MKDSMASGEWGLCNKKYLLQKAFRIQRSVIINFSNKKK